MKYGKISKKKYGLIFGEGALNTLNKFLKQQKHIVSKENENN